MKRIAFVTYKGLKSLSPGDRLLGLALGRLDYMVTPCIWNDSKVKWSDFDTVVMRSAWDYHLTYPEFLDWLGRIENTGVPVFNSLPLMRWNSHKSYLPDLEKKGVEIIPTVLIRRGGYIDRDVIRDRFGSGLIVVKPAVGTSGSGVIRHRSDDHRAINASVNRLLRHTDVLLQEYFPEIESTGELSLVYLGGKFSHAVEKLPRHGEFRVQAHLGVRERIVGISRGLLTQADGIMSALAARTLYSRIDGVVRNGRLYLMELELVEPNLFIDLAPHTADIFARKLMELLPVV